MYPTPTQSPPGAPQMPYQGYGYGEEEAARNEFMQRVLASFGATLLVAAGGAVAGWSLPPAAYLGLIVLQLVLLLAVVFTRANNNVSPILLYAFAACSGATTVPLIKWAIAVSGGTAVVYNALAITGAMFCGLAWYGHSTKKDLSGWGPFLMMGLFGAIIAGIVGMFVTYSPPNQILLSGVIVLIFAGFTAYDINQIKTHWREYTVTRATLNLYLDFLNLFVNVLRILALLSGGGSNRD